MRTHAIHKQAPFYSVNTSASRTIRHNLVLDNGGRIENTMAVSDIVRNGRTEKQILEDYFKGKRIGEGFDSRIIVGVEVTD
jgi:hypothetical protein